MSAVYAYEKEYFWRNLSWPDWRRLCVDLRCIRTALCVPALCVRADSASPVLFCAKVSL